MGLLAAAKLFLGGALKSIFGFLAKLPWQVWVGLAALALGLFGWHEHKVAVKRADAAGYARAKQDDIAAMDRLRERATKLRVQAESLGANVAVSLRERHNAQADRIDAVTDDIVRKGPGKASCGRLDYPVAPASPGRQEPPGGAGTSAVAPVPDSGGTALIALPFADTVRLIGQCDINRHEVLTWRENDDKQRSIWDEYRKTLAAPPK